MRKLMLTMCVFVMGSMAMAQEPVSSFATVGRQEPQSGAARGIQRTVDRIDDKFDRKVCCGYGKSHNEMGVPGFRGTKAFMWGSACEFFAEPCRTPPPRTSSSKASRVLNEMFGSESSCSNCGK